MLLLVPTTNLGGTAEPAGLEASDGKEGFLNTKSTKRVDAVLGTMPALVPAEAS